MDAVERLEAVVKRDQEERRQAPRPDPPMRGSRILAWSAPYAVMVVVVSALEYMYTLGLPGEGVTTFLAIAALLVAPLGTPLVALAHGGSRVLRLVLGLHATSIALLGLTRINASSMVPYPGSMLDNVVTEVAIAWLIFVFLIVLLLFGAALLLRRLPSLPRNRRWDDV